MENRVAADLTEHVEAPQQGMTGGRPRGKARSHQKLRLGIQAAVLAYVTLAAIGHATGWSWAANLHTICPFGGVENLHTYSTTGNYVAKLHDAVFVMLIGLVLGLVLTGKSFCGWICPLGTVQELLAKAGRFLRGGRRFFVLPDRLDHVLSFGKFVVLAWVLVQTARMGKLAFEAYDPYYALFNIWSDEIAWTGYAVVGLTLGLSLFVERPFCRYACPLGALNGLFNRVSVLTLKRDPASCVDCGRCDRACPVGIPVSTLGSVSSSECTRCLMCVEACPVNSGGEGTLQVRSILGGARKPIRWVPAPAFFSVAVLAFALPILITNLTGDFGTETEHVYTEPADIKGSSPLGDIVKNFGVSQGELYRGLAIPDAVPLDTKLKDVQALMGLAEGAEIVVPENVRTAIGALDTPLAALIDTVGIPRDRVDETLRTAGLASDATVRQLMSQGAPGAVAYLISGEWPTPPPTDGAATDDPAERGGAAEEGSTSPTVRGTTTLRELKEMVEDYPAFLAAFDIPTDEPETNSLKDLVGKYGFDIPEVRAYVESDPGQPSG